jgi:cytochrome c1
MAIKRIIPAALAAVLSLAVPYAQAAEGKHPAKDIGFAFEGPFGTFDRAQLQRGYLVYKDVCAACHSMKLIYFRNLGQPGGPEFPEPEVKAIAATFEVDDGPNETGEMYKRPGLPSDRFLQPFPNDQAGRAANGGALPPDLSLITKARAGWSGSLLTLYTTHLIKGIGGPEYVYSVLTGYQDPPTELAKEAPEGKHYNPYFENGPWISMTPPLSDGQVTYGDGTQATVDQMSRDVSAFLAWAAEPKMEERKRAGFQVLIYLAVFTVLVYLLKKLIWARVEH